MPPDSPATSPPAQGAARWLEWKRYILIFVSAVTIVLILPGAFGESDKWTHIPDDAIISALAIGVIAVIVLFWKSFPLRGEPKSRRLVQWFFVGVLLAQVAGLALEYSDSNEVGNEYIGFILLTVGLVVAYI